ncbi:MAG: XRE family transcriptional regulator [Clostridiales bacterium]|nr:XRE family transcriptional regulator [Clostridiales bacterium]
MYNAQILSTRIKNRAVEKNIYLNKMLDDCGLNVNSINQMTDKKGLASFSLARIADYLDCSVDYLLGRTDNPEVNK